MTITTYTVVEVESGKYTCINKDDPYSQIVGGVFSTPTASFYYSLKELDQSHDGPFVVEYLKKKESDVDGSEKD